jgi:2-dehydro-3-deoxygluconokinase
LRASGIVYDRADSAFARSEPGDFDWEAALADAGHLHLSGITPALTPSVAGAALAAAREAKRRGLRISFDGNYRPSLWAASGRESEARTVLRGLVELADVFFGNHRDISLLLGRDFAGGDAGARRAAAEAAFAAFANLSLIAATARDAEHADHHRLSARIDTRAGGFETEALTLSGIVDRIGGGDAFAAGVLHAWHAHEGDIAAIARTGLALGALKHFVPGDSATFSQDDIDRFIDGDRDVRR